MSRKKVATLTPPPGLPSFDPAWAEDGVILTQEQLWSFWYAAEDQLTAAEKTTLDRVLERMHGADQTLIRSAVTPGRRRAAVRIVLKHARRLAREHA